MFFFYFKNTIHTDRVLALRRRGYIRSDKTEMNSDQQLVRTEVIVLALVLAEIAAHVFLRNHPWLVVAQTTAALLATLAYYFAVFSRA